MVENKEESINRAITRVKELDLKNVTIFQVVYLKSHVLACTASLISNY